MSLVPVLHGNASIKDALRRAFRTRRVRVVGCRTLGRVERLLGESLVEAIVIELRKDLAGHAFRLASEFSAIPVFGLATFRPDDGPLLADCARAGLNEIFVLGVDEPVISEIVVQRSAGSQRRRALDDAPRLLGLTEPVQLRAWDEILDRVDEPTRTQCLAQALGLSREHLSREFAAGGAPNLKRVIDLARLACAAHLLSNPRYTVADVSRILHFSSASHLAGSARRITGGKPSELADLGPRGVLQRFRRGRTRSRLPWPS